MSACNTTSSRLDVGIFHPNQYKSLCPPSTPSELDAQIQIYQPLIRNTDKSLRGVTSDVTWGVAWGIWILIKNKLQNLSVIRKTNLLSLINHSLAHVYCSTTLSNYGLIRLNRFISQISLNLCIQFHKQSIFNTPCMCSNIQWDSD